MYWDGKRPCWEIIKCFGQPGRGVECAAYKFQKIPCWDAVVSRCTEGKGSFLRDCYNCEVYLGYSEGRPIAMQELLKSKGLIKNG